MISPDLLMPHLTSRFANFTLLLQCHPPVRRNAQHTAVSDRDQFQPSSPLLTSSLAASPIGPASLGQILSKMAITLPPSSISAIPSSAAIQLVACPLPSRR